MGLLHTSTARQRSFTAMVAALLAFPAKSSTPPTDRSAIMQFTVDVSTFLTVQRETILARRYCAGKHSRS
jgi:hypothetical protein